MMKEAMRDLLKNEYDDLQLVTEILYDESKNFKNNEFNYQQFFTKESYGNNNEEVIRLNVSKINQEMEKTFQLIDSTDIPKNIEKDLSN